MGYLEWYGITIFLFFVSSVLLGRHMFKKDLNREQLKKANNIFDPGTLIWVSLFWPLALVVGFLIHLTDILEDFIKGDKKS